MLNVIFIMHNLTSFILFCDCYLRRIYYIVENVLCLLFIFALYFLLACTFLSLCNRALIFETKPKLFIGRNIWSIFLDGIILIPFPSARTYCHNVPLFTLITLSKKIKINKLLSFAKAQMNYGTTILLKCIQNFTSVLLTTGSFQWCLSWRTCILGFYLQVYFCSVSNNWNSFSWRI